MLMSHQCKLMYNSMKYLYLFGKGIEFTHITKRRYHRDYSLR